MKAMTPQERTATIAGLFGEMLATLPTESSAFFLTRDEIKEREAAGQRLGNDLRYLARNK